MLVRLRLPRASLAAAGVVALTALAPSLAAAADDAPAPETGDQTKSAATGRKTPEQWAPDTSDSKVSSFGTFTTSIAIDVPDFRKIAPELALTYRSSDANGWLGVGWSLDGIGRIERASAGRGAPRYDATDVYLLDGEELVPCAVGSTSPSCTSGGTHSTKTESYLRIALAGTGTAAQWTVTAKDGTKSVYHSVLTVPGADGATGTVDDQIFRWGLGQVIDTKGNAVTYTWGANLFGGAWDYLDTVTYNGTTVKLHYEQRTDIESSAAGSGVLSAVHGRIKTIDVTVNGSRARSYKLTYATSAATNRSLLVSVQQFGKDTTLDASGTVTGGTSFPAITAGYPAANSPAFVAGTSDANMGATSGQRFLTLDIDGDGKTDMMEVWKTCLILCAYRAAGWISNGTTFTRTAELAVPGLDETAQYLTADVNGDGKDDFISLTNNGNGKWRRSVFLSTGAGFTAGVTDTSMTYKVDTVDGEKFVRSHFLPMDINGDGKTDLFEVYPRQDCFLCATTYSRAAWISDGSGFTKVSDVAGMAYDKKSEFLPMDINGDGKWEFVELKPAMLNVLELRVHVSDGTAFTAVPGWTTSAYSSKSRFLTMDINGDGKTDLFEMLPEGIGTRKKTWLSTGTGFKLGSSTWLTGGIDSGTRLLAGDVNGDGRSDYVELAPVFLAVQRRIFLSKGDDFVIGSTDLLGNQGSHKYLAADINGDGRSDLIELYSWLGMTTRTPWLLGGPAPDLLSSLGGGIGGTTSVSYTPSSAWANTNNAAIVQTTTSVAVADGRGSSSTTTYSYAGGRYDVLDQRFVGFASRKETQPCIAGESACPYTEITFRQDNGALGKPSRIDERDGAGTLLRSRVFDYTTNGAALPWTALRTGRWKLSFDGTGAACPGAQCKRTYTATSFNAYGEPTQEVDYGDYDVTGDEETRTTTFVPNTTAYVVELPADVKTFQGIGTSGALLGETVTFYDGATSWNVTPAAGLPTKTARWLSSPSAFVETKTEYDAWGNVTASEDALGARTTSTFDPTYHQFPTSVTNALGQMSTTTWDGVCGTPTRTTNLNGQATTLTYDALCRLSQQTAPGGKTETHAWVSLGDPANQYEELQRPSADGTANPWFSRRYFDGLNRTWREVKKGPDTGTGNIFVDKTYNARGEVASKTAPYYGGAATFATTFDYDALDRRTRITHPDGTHKSTSYGLWSITTTDELGRPKTDRFNAKGRRIAHDEVVGGVTKTTTYVYDARHALQQSTDPAGNVVVYTTDSLGRRRSMVDPSSGTWTYDYDGAGQLVTQIDPKNQRTTFEYDHLGRKTGKTSLDGTAAASTATWTYDESRTGFYNLGALTTVTDGAGTKELDYDVAGRVVNSVRTIDGATYVFQYGFDAGDRPLWTTYPDGDTLGTPAAPLTYDSAGRLKAVPGYVSSVRYNADGDVTELANANGTVTTRTYSEARGWITGIKTMSGATRIQDLVYARNAKGMVSQLESPIANEGWTYGYDELDRVTTATNATNAANNQSLTYDAIGNITSSSRRGDYTYGSRPHAVTVAGGSSYSYDAAGLMTSGPDRTMTWNGDNRLATITNAGMVTTFTYDADGNRIQQLEGTTVRRYLGDDYEITSLGSTTKYISIAGSLVARKEGTTKTWIHTDALGSIQAETASSGAEVHRKQYRPYGEILSSSGSLDDEPRGFTGQRQDASGLVYLHARYYDPALGRFISPDLIVDGPDTVGLNRHAYVGNNPINATDPTGLAAVAQSANKNGKAKDKSKDPPPPPPPPPPRPPSYPSDADSPAPVVNAPAPPRPPAAAVNVQSKASSSRASTTNSRANVARSAAPSQRTPVAATTARAAVPQRRDNRRSERNAARSTESSGWRSPLARQPQVQLLTGPLDEDDDFVVECWANLHIHAIGEEAWLRVVGDPDQCD